MEKKKLKYDTILLLGPQGSGKTTQLGYLLEVIDAFSASVGQIIRDTITDSEKEEHKKAYQDMVSGKLIDDSITHGLLVEAMTLMREKGDTKPHLIFDGFPRSIHQATTVHDLAEVYHGRKPKIAVVQMSMDFDASKKRCLDRAEYNKNSGKPVRADDTHDAIHARLELYFNNAPHVYGILGEVADIHTFDAHKSREEIHSDVLAKLFE
ncbi:MAG: nucleoside monophosphate kinase [Candidatus Taylorbacteria bacterium]|nr:nucleoside monophosphate kinase [Candidatus Taylorbacteria bacterium]